VVAASMRVCELMSEKRVKKLRNLRETLRVAPRTQTLSVSSPPPGMYVRATYTERERENRASLSLFSQ